MIREIMLASQVRRFLQDPLRIQGYGMLRQFCVTQLTTINDIGTACAIRAEPTAVRLTGKRKAGAELRGDPDAPNVRAGSAELLPSAIKP